MKKKSAKKLSNNEKSKSLKPLYIFIGKFFSIIAVYYILVLAFADSLFGYYLQFTAVVSSGILNILGFSTTVSGNMIISDGAVLQLLFGCEGTDPIIIFIAGMVAIPRPFKKKLLPLIVGTVSLYFLNFIRILVLFKILTDYPNLFEDFHIIYLPVVFIFLALICLGLCIKWLKVR